MKFSINRTYFVEKLNDVQLAISSRTTIPILTGIKLTASGNQLTLTGSNADISIESTLVSNKESALSIDQVGAVVVQPARMLTDIIKKLPDQEVEIEVTDNYQVSIKSETSSFVINGIDADQYPHLPEIDTSKKISLPVNLLRQVIRQTTIAVSNHESRPILTGVQFLIEDGKLTATATDSHRLSKRIIPLEEADGQNFQFVIPGKSLTEFNRLLDDDLETVGLYMTESQVLFDLPHTHFYSRLLEGNYPNTDQLIPTESNTSVLLPAEDLKAAVDRASLLSHAGKNNVIKLVINNQTMEVKGDYPGVGKIEENIPFESIEGDDIEISFNPDYMKQALNAFGPTQVSIELVGSLRPFVIKPGDGNDNFVQLITPIRTPD